MSELARRHGLKRLIAPVRPSWKERYPLTPIERYVTWRRDDGQLFDRGCGCTSASAPGSRRRSRTRCGSPAASPSGSPGPAWLYPEDGDYVFPHGLAPLHVADGIGRYFEPNVWLVDPQPTT